MVEWSHNDKVDTIGKVPQIFEQEQEKKRALRQIPSRGNGSGKGGRQPGLREKEGAPLPPVRSESEKGSNVC